MSKRRYINVAALLPSIENILANRMTHRQIEEELGLEGDPEAMSILIPQMYPGFYFALKTISIYRRSYISHPLYY